MQIHWDTCLFYLGIILLTPKRGVYCSERAILSLAAGATVIEVSWVRVSSMNAFIQYIPLLIAGWRMWMSQKSLMKLELWTKSFLVAAFVFRCTEFYPFSYWHNMRCDFISGCLICFLVQFFVSNQEDITTLWSMVYVSMVLFYFAVNGTLDANVTQYWKTETVFILVMFAKHSLSGRLGRRGERIV